MGNKKESGLPGTAPARPFTGRQIKAKAMAAVIFYLGFSPLFLLPGAYLKPESPATGLLLPLSALLLSCTAGLLPARRRRIAFLIAMLLQASLCAWVLLPSSPLSALLFLPCRIMMRLFMPAMARPSGLEWSAPQLSQGVALHLIGQALKGLAVFESAASTLSLFFSGYLLLCLFAFNRYALIGAARTEQSPPAKLLHQNRRILAAFSLIAILTAGWQSFEAAALAVWDFLKKAFATILLWLSMLLPQLTPVNERGAPQGFDLGMLGEASEPSALSLILEKVLTVLAVIIAALLALFALYQLLRLLKRLLKNLLSQIRNYSRAIGEGYVDKTESLLDWGEVMKSAKDRWASFQKRHRKLPAWESLSPRDRVRRVYALLTKRLKNPVPSLTARESLQNGGLSLPPTQAQQIASLYEQARYSDHPISPEEADDARKSAGV